MIALPEGVTVYVHGREWKKEIPAVLCPKHLKPASADKGKATPAAPAKEA